MPEYCILVSLSHAYVCNRSSRPASFLLLLLLDHLTSEMTQYFRTEPKLLDIRYTIYLPLSRTVGTSTNSRSIMVKLLKFSFVLPWGQNYVFLSSRYVYKASILDERNFPFGRSISWGFYYFDNRAFCRSRDPINENRIRVECQRTQHSVILFSFLNCRHFRVNNCSHNVSFL